MAYYKKTSIAIVGDSFGVGELDTNKPVYTKDPEPRHPGTELFLRQLNYDVENLSQGGATQSEIIKQIDKISSKKDFTIIFVTDPWRDYKNFRENWIKLCKSTTPWSKIYDTLHTDFLHTIILKCSQIKTIPILVGGQANFKQEHLPKHNSFIIATHDWIKDITGKEFGALTSIATEFLDFIARHCVDRQRVYDFVDALPDRFNHLDSHRDFPDGCHPSINCHGKLAKKIDKIIKEYQSGS